MGRPNRPFCWSNASAEELSSHTPEDPKDMWAGPCTIGLDTGCGKGGFLTTLELPNMSVYESRRPINLATTIRIP